MFKKLLSELDNIIDSELFNPKGAAVWFITIMAVLLFIVEF